MANSITFRDHLTARSISSDKINVIYNGLDLSRFENAESSREKFGLPTDKNIRLVTLVANLRHAVKNVPMFLRVAKLVADALPNTQFVVAGEGELETELKAMAAELGIDKRFIPLADARIFGAAFDVIGVCSDINRRRVFKLPTRIHGRRKARRRDKRRRCCRGC
ncbi:MAG: glycosyltransferase [Chloracidobacterium sp.]|nr:glycosyltransferase [Chloracidobacterium sp.]